MAGKSGNAKSKTRRVGVPCFVVTVYPGSRMGIRLKGGRKEYSLALVRVWGFARYVNSRVRMQRVGR
jgi:hypothetical protein